MRENITCHHKIRVGILEDDNDMREFLVSLVAETKDMVVAFEADSVLTATEYALREPFDICLVDLHLPDGSGTDFIEQQSTHTSTKFLILTVFGDKRSVLTSLKSGANGYLLKDSSPNHIRESIRITIAGATPLNPEAASHLLNVFTKENSSRPGTGENQASLSVRETDVLTMLSRGLSYEETASALDLSRHTIGDHVKSIYKKLSVHSKNEAIYEAVRTGLITL